MLRWVSGVSSWLHEKEWWYSVSGGKMGSKISTCRGYALMRPEASGETLPVLHRPAGQVGR